MLRNYTCGDLNIKNLNQNVILCGWVQRIRDKGGIIWIDLRDRYGITQLLLEEKNSSTELINHARTLGREFVIQVEGKVIERFSKNPKMITGDIEIKVEKINILNKSLLPPFTIEDDTDGGEELRAKFRYLDLRRNILRNNLELRHKLAQEVRKYLDSLNFLEIETPMLIKSTPEGARDFVVPSRVFPGEFYALPQSPQNFKQLLMIAGYDRYFQIVKCFRDEDLRSDRQPEFTQIDCEMSFVEQEDIINTFEGLAKHLFKTIKGIEFKDDFVRISYDDAMKFYGTDKPDLRFDMKFVELNDIVKNQGFKVFDEAELVVGICAKGVSEYTRKQIDELTEFVKQPQVGATGLVYLKYNLDGSLKSSVDKFYNPDKLQEWANKFNASKGDLILILAGKKEKTQKALSELRLEMGTRLGIRDNNSFVPLWVVDFPLYEWDEETKRLYAKHHPFTSPKTEDIAILESDPISVKANAYDFVINGVEIGGGSIRIFDENIQKQMLKMLGFTEEDAVKQFGYLMNAFKYGAPPHGGIALGFDRLVAMFCGVNSIRDVIAFPKNNSGKDVMIDSPSTLFDEQLKELHLKIEVGR